MRKITYILLSLFIFSTTLFSQSEIDALRFSRGDLHGTARAMSMGGAFGALGGDMTGVSINPAGIAVYRSSEVTGTINWSREKSSVGSLDVNKYDFDMDNIGFVGYFPLRNDVVPLINFGFSYNKQKSFDKKVSAGGESYGTLVDYIYNDYLSKLNQGIITSPDDLKWIENEQDPFLNGQPWLQVLGFNNFLLNPDQQGKNLIPLDTRGEKPNSKIQTFESGYIDNYDFTLGTTINNVLNLGLSLSVNNINYNLTSIFDEEYADGGYTLNNSKTVKGAGIGAKFGAIYRPVKAIRIGLAWHTPTWYALRETYRAEMLQDVKSYVPSYVKYTEEGLNSKAYNDYDLKVPGKLVASVATVLGNSFIASMDYELVNYGTMKLKVPSGSMDSPNWYDTDNQYIKQDFKPTSTVKLGAEYRFTPQFYGRLGYAWMQNPYDKDSEIKKFGLPLISSTNTIFRVEGDTNYITGGLGYRFNRNFYLDMAVVYKTQEDKLYPFPNFYTEGQLTVDAAPFTLKNNSLRGLLTLGYRF